jgi:hypothetical protein
MALSTGEQKCVGALDGKEFHSDQHVPTTHEHYVKVREREFFY